MGKLAFISIITLLIISVLSPFGNVKAQVTYSFSLNGPVNESDFTYLSGDVNATAHFASGEGADEAFYFNNAYIYNSSYPVRYFSFEYNNSGTIQHREYWLSPAEQTGVVNTIWATFTDGSLTTYVISFMDQVGILETYPYIEAQIFVLGTYHTIEKRLVDEQKIVVMELIVGARYKILFSNSATSTTYGDITTTSTTGIQLIIRGVDFPKETLALYQYVHTYSIRDFLNPIGAITTSYEDTTNQTTSVTITITDDEGTVAFSQVFTDQTFSNTWNSAVNATSYTVTVDVIHITFGSFSYKQYLLGEYTKATTPFDMSFLGSSMGISTAVLIPALLIIFVAGCFSELTAETAAILTVLIAIVLSALGWIEITQAAIITALALSVMAGIIAAKRRMQIY